MITRTIPITVIVLTVFCTTSCSTTGPDVREQMLEASKRQDPNFPDGENLKLTHFAYMGTVIAKGETLRVVEAAAVIPNMPAPRGQAWLYFFDGNNRLVGTHPVRRTLPRWCEGSRVYFFGLEGNGEQEGNALDLSAGFDKRRYVFDPAPGSWTESASAN